MADSSHTKQKIQKPLSFNRFPVSAKPASLQLSFCCRFPAEPARLQLSFNVAATWQVCVAACICSFFSNPFAFANVPLLPSGFCCRCYLQVSVAAATFRFLLPLLPSGFCYRCYLQISVTAATFRFASKAAAAREFPHFQKIIQTRPTIFIFNFAKKRRNGLISKKKSSNSFKFEKTKNKPN
ncbi:hypothetical protein MmiHf6_15000 [Methanimicrococcus hongohii]|uniref:Uncharacterized protein n=1 Tax=Methanimicrococcus hongohii TaxID=3028295 RepID=A0AA96ZUC4_9EURY|nr:hypothetical protein [Methanimicrococcus sp. Hf6]WNY24171.1 hypothetical protein MmiHf6_15000 [Methanimicrococcus sp. Hf6]